MRIKDYQPISVTGPAFSIALIAYAEQKIQTSSDVSYTYAYRLPPYTDTDVCHPPTMEIYWVESKKLISKENPEYQKLANVIPEDDLWIITRWLSSLQRNQ